MKGQFVKEIAEKNMTDAIMKFYEVEGCTFKYKTDTVEIWYEPKESEKAVLV